MLSKLRLFSQRSTSNEVEMSEFTKRYNLFKELLEKNTAALRLINDIEDVMLNPSSFDYDEVVEQCERLVEVVRSL